MSWWLGRTPAKKRGGKAPERPEVPRPPAGTIKFIELYGELTSIPKGQYRNIISFEVPRTYACEVYAIGVQPDLDVATNTSNCDRLYIAKEDKPFIGPIRVNHIGQNALPYGDRASRRPLWQLDEPLKRDNLTAKFNEGDVFNVQIYAKDDADVTNQSELESSLTCLMTWQSEPYTESA